MKKDKIIKKMVMMAMFAAMAYVLAFVAHFLHLNIVPNVPFLNYDPKDIIICIASFILGPSAGFIISVVVSLLEMITISTTGFYGFVMNVISTCALVIPASIIYKYKKTFKGALLSLLIGFVSVIITMTLWNIIVTPIYMGIDRVVLINNFLGWIVLFNVIKVLINIALTLILYKPLTKLLKASRLLEKTSNDSTTKTTLLMFTIGGVLLIVLIVTIILLKTLG